MSAAIAQPVTQVRLTNVAVVRLKKQGVRFEVAAYKNKVVNWRNKVETDLDEVLQLPQVFMNVSKGIVANNKDLIAAFGTTDHEVCARYILDHGQLQVSDKERNVEHESVFRDIATIIAAKCVHPDSKRPYTVTMICRALKHIHFAIKPGKNAKQQALEVIPQLAAVMPIERAKMKLRAAVPAAASAELKAQLTELGCSIANERSTSKECTLTFLADPSVFKQIEGATATAGGQLTILEQQVAEAGESKLDELDDVALAAFVGDASAEADGAAADPEAAAAPTGTPARLGVVVMPGTSAEGKSKLTCKACGTSFEDRNLHREHFRTDWHRYNLKRQLKNLKPVAEAIFNGLDETERELFFAEL